VSSVVEFYNTIEFFVITSKPQQ